MSTLWRGDWRPCIADARLSLRTWMFTLKVGRPRPLEFSLKVSIRWVNNCYIILYNPNDFFLLLLPSHVVTENYQTHSKRANVGEHLDPLPDTCLPILFNSRRWRDPRTIPKNPRKMLREISDLYSNSSLLLPVCSYPPYSSGGLFDSTVLLICDNFAQMKWGKEHFQKYCDKRDQGLNFQNYLSVCLDILLWTDVLDCVDV